MMVGGALVNVVDEKKDSLSEIAEHLINLSKKYPFLKIYKFRDELDESTKIEIVDLLTFLREHVDEYIELCDVRHVAARVEITLEKSRISFFVPTKAKKEIVQT